MMAWVLIFSSCCLFLISMLLAVFAGVVAALKSNSSGSALLFLAAITLLGAMGLLFSAGMMFGGA